MSGQDLASFASGITGSFFGGLLEDRQNEQKRKDEELARQLAAYHALLEHPDTPESEIPNILDAQARLLKAEKDFAPITAHMREAMKRQVPYGPERETAGSINDRVSANNSGVPEMDVQLPGSVAMRPTAANPGGTPSGEAAMTVTRSAVLPTVPPEPDMYQPTREYGSLSQGEATDIRKGNLYADQQTEMTRRILATQAQAAETAANRERIRAEGARKLEEDKQKGRVALVRTTYEEKTKMLPVAAQAKTESERLLYRNSLIATGMNKHDADVASFQLFRSQVDTQLAERKQKVEESKARMVRFGVQNAESWERIRKSKTATGLLGGMSSNAQREFGLRTGTLQAEMASVLRQLEVLYKKRDDEGPERPDVHPRQDAIDALEAQKADLWTNIDAVRNDLLNRSVPSVPGMPGASRTPARQGKDPLGLFAQ